MIVIWRRHKARCYVVVADRLTASVLFISHFFCLFVFLFSYSYHAFLPVSPPLRVLSLSSSLSAPEPSWPSTPAPHQPPHLPAVTPSQPVYQPRFSTSLFPVFPVTNPVCPSVPRSTHLHPLSSQLGLPTPPPLQFAYKAKRGTEDAVALHSLESPANFARLIFID